MTIGRFASLTAIPVSTLRFYDEQGLLRPAAIDARNHYRLYSLQQLESAFAIRLLREMDIPLEEIRAALALGSSKVGSLLEHHRRRITERRLELARIARRLNRLLLGGSTVLGYDVREVDVEPTRVVSRRATPPRDAIDDTIEVLLRETHETMSALDRSPEAPREIVLYRDILRRDGRVELEVCVPLSRGSTDAGGSWELPGGRAARMFHHGPWDDVYLAYAALLSWIVGAGEEVDGPLREVYVTDNRDTTEPGDYVTELTWLLL